MLALAAGLVACSTGGGKLDVRARAAAVEATDFAHAMARGHELRGRGEFALAIDHYRAALRLQPSDAQALTALATCYDGIGRYDLGRRYHELALAAAPSSEDAVMEFARSLARQGQVDAAASLIDDFRVAGPEATRAALAALAPPPPVAAPLADPVALPPTALPRLERRDTGVVALVTRETAEPAPVRAAGVAPPKPAPAVQPVAAAPASTLVVKLDPPAPARAPVVVVNAVGREGQAGRLSRYLAQRGWVARLRDTPARLATSRLHYAPAQQAEAERLRRELPFPVALVRTGQPGVRLVLGYNALAFDDRLRRRRA
jgi:tetratricopeptide (TPR) repeat protein